MLRQFIPCLIGFCFTAMLALNAAAQEARPFQRPRPPREGRDLRTPDKLQKGDAAPDFTLKKMHGKEDEAVTLSDFQGQRPVALVFGSYT